MDMSTSPPPPPGEASRTNPDKKERRNVNHACEPCRQRKVKCDGNREGCASCLEYLRACYFGKSKKELNRSKIADLQIRVDTYTTLLRKLQPHTDGESQLAIAKALASSSVSVSHSMVDSESSSQNALAAELDSVPEANPFHESDPSGAVSEFAFMGYASEVTVLRRLMQEISPGTENSSLGGPSVAIPEYVCNAYHLDDLAVSADDHIDHLQLPDKHLAQWLLTIYLDTVHPLYPIVWKEDLTEIYHNAYMPMPESRRSEAELAVLNLVFAIGQHFIDRFVLERNQFSDLHGIYFMRAKVLIDMTDGCMFSVATLQKVQFLGLSGIYLVACNQTNRAWHVVGLGLRMANAIGLHVQTELPDLSFEHKEQRSRAWYSLCYLESILCTMTGRPSVLGHRYSAVNAPRALPHENGNNAAINLSSIDPYMAASASLSVIIGDILGRLFTERQDTSVAGWEEMRRTVELLTMHLESWRRGLPEILSFDKPKTDQTFIHKRFDLAVRYSHANLLLRRPCLVRPETLPNAIKGSPGLNDFITASATRCVEDARGIVDLVTVNFIADGTNAVRLGPWWCILHYAVSAASILLQDMAQGGTGSPTQQEAVFEAAVALLVWIDALSAQGWANVGTRNCGLELVALLARISSGMGRHFSSEMVMHRPQQVDSFAMLMSSDFQSPPVPAFGSGIDNPPLYFPSTTFLHEPGSSGFSPTLGSETEY